MKLISDILPRNPVWVNPSHRVESAIWLMRGHDVDALPVLDGERVVGMVLSRRLLGIEGQRQVDSVMESCAVSVLPSYSVREVADVMLGEALQYLPVVTEEGSLLGMVSRGDLIAELRRSTDPITELPWSDSMREWAIERLQAGHEITLLFVDLNDFGQFNKRFGHIVGDAVLRNVASILRDLVDADNDSLCRYGGDEFCIATLQSAADATQLAERIVREVQRLRMLEVPEKSVQVTVGQRGGRRTREREHIHYAATLNNLINLASQDCIARKENHRQGDPADPEADDVAAALSETELLSPDEDPSPAFSGPVEESVSRSADEEAGTMEARSAPERQERLRLALLDVLHSGENSSVRVELERREPAQMERITAPKCGTVMAGAESSSLSRITYGSELSQAAEGGGLFALVAETTLAALRRALPFGYDVRLDEVLTAQTADGRALVTVVAHFVTPHDTHPIAGSVFIGQDAHRAVARATLAATNRMLGRLPDALTKVAAQQH